MTRSTANAPTPESQLKGFVALRAPKTQALFKAVRAALRKRFPTANELAYEYGHSLIISYSPSENGIEGIFGLAAKETGVLLYFSQGPNLPDPKKLLQGKAKMVRFIELHSAKDLGTADVKGFIVATLKQAKKPFPTKGKGQLIIKSGGKKKATSK